MAASPLAYDPTLTRRGLSREQFDVLVAAGSWARDHVELIEGEIVDMVPQGPGHASLVGRVATTLDRALYRTHGDRYVVRPQTPLAVSGRSEPEPDVAVIDKAADLTTAHPTTAHLVIEIAQTSQRIDLVHKPRIYADAGVGDYWVVDLATREVVVHRGPLGRGTEAAGYRSVERHPADTVLAVLGVEIRFGDLLD